MGRGWGTEGGATVMTGRRKDECRRMNEHEGVTEEGRRGKDSANRAAG